MNVIDESSTLTLETLAFEKAENQWKAANIDSTD